MRSTRPSGTDPSFKFRFVRGALGALGLVASAMWLSSCIERPLCSTCHPVTTNIFVESVPQKLVNKVDLLFMIDNSSSMADKQQVLSEAVPDLVNRLVNPDCVRASDGSRAKGPTCPDGFAREFQPVGDIHVGVITSSLGGHGGKACPRQEDAEYIEQGDDKGELIATRPRFGVAASKASGLQPPTKEGFLDWNPGTHPNQDVNAFSATFTVMTKSAGQKGCGYEAQLEAVYRFLVDPNPSAAVVARPCTQNPGVDCAFKQGTDSELLAQRAAFLRPDSLVAIIMLTDENDCSVQDTLQGYYATLDEKALRAGSSACGVNPNDKCCYPCGTTVPDGCAADPKCVTPTDANPNPAYVPRSQDAANLRCYQQKRRFGYDYLYPTQRYVNALTQSKICTTAADLDVRRCAPNEDKDADGKPDLADNPLFASVNGALPRQKSLVFFAGILGVPWQDLQATKDENELHYKRASVMAKDGTWDTILGDPHPPNDGAPIPPKDSLMIESIDPRGGKDGLGEDLAAPGSAPFANHINGHEWVNPDRVDLQYACIFPLPVDPGSGQKTRTCSAADLKLQLCDCDGKDGPTTKDADHPRNPLCQNPANGDYGDGLTQYFAKAYPGTRELEVLKAFGDNSIVASICARELDDKNDQSYGYRPAVDAIIDRLKDALSDKCLPRKLERDATGAIPCSVVEVIPRTAGGICDPGRGRKEPNAEVVTPVLERLRAAGRCDVENQPRCSDFQLCELQEAGPACHKAGGTQTEAGWCYVDPEHNKDDDASLVEKCPPNERRIMRFVDVADRNETPAPGATVLIACFGADASDDSPAVVAAPQSTSTSTGVHVSEVGAL